ncbi:MAG: DUF1670 domain-containing protein [Syntrophorhabdales bacterium]|jgi:hypothetical protein
MMRAPDPIRRYNSAKARFLKGVLDRFFRKEFPKLIGPLLRSKLVEELINLLEKTLPLKDHVQPGQVVWSVVSLRTRADALNPVFVPVVLTLVDEGDIDTLAKGTRPPKVAPGAMARMMKEAYAQGGLLSMRDLTLLTWRDGSSVSKFRRRYEQEHDMTLPHTGSLQDVGSCISHKSTIVRKVVVDKKDPLTASRETNHSMPAVDRYLKDFHRVRLCQQHGKDADFISFATGINKHVVNEYIKIAEQCENASGSCDGVTSCPTTENQAGPHPSGQPEHSTAQGRRPAEERT